MKWTGRICFLSLGLFVLTLLAMGWGTIPLTPEETVRYIWLSITDPYGQGSIQQDAIQFIRLPHMVLSFLIGSGLAICGAVMQAVMRNPLADPYLLGISSGASLGAVLAIALGIGSVFGLDGTGAFAFAGAGLVSLLILFMASVTGKGDSLTLLLSGFALNAACSAAVSFIVTAMAEPNKTRSIQFWMMGNIMTGSWIVTLILSIVVGGGFLYFLLQRRVLDLMLMGDALSLSMGRNLAVYRKWYIGVTALMVGSIVYVSGMVGFVGLLIPHAVRLAVGSTHRRVIPMSGLAGGCFLVWADIIGRNAVPGMELPIGITAALVGAPFFLWMLFKRKYSGGQS